MNELLDSYAISCLTMSELLDNYAISLKKKALFNTKTLKSLNPQTP